jgi:hypothetical protein
MIGSLLSDPLPLTLTSDADVELQYHFNEFGYDFIDYIAMSVPRPSIFTAHKSFTVQMRALATLFKASLL